MPIVQSRRRFLNHLGAAGVAGLGGVGAAGLGGGARSFAAEPPPEITTIRLEKAPTTCLAPQYVAEELLRAEGFTDIRYQTSDTEAPAQAVAPKRVGLGSGLRTGGDRRGGQHHPTDGRAGVQRG